MTPHEGKQLQKVAGEELKTHHRLNSPTADCEGDPRTGIRARGMSTYSVREKPPGQRRDSAFVNAPSALLPVLACPLAEDRDPLASDHCADAVLDLLHSRGWAVVSTPESNVHCTSPDNRIYVGWLPEDASAWHRGIVWRVTVHPATAERWTQEFSLDTPTEAVAAFLLALIDPPRPATRT